MKDTAIKAGTYCPVCRGVSGADCWHNATEFNAPRTDFNTLDKLSSAQVENAALKADNELLRSLSFRDERDSLKEQVAQLKELNENHAFNAKYFKAESETLQSKSAALELEMKEISDRAFETLNRTPTVYYQGLKNIMERACAALAAAKGEK